MTTLPVPCAGIAQGGETLPVYDTDGEILFRQEAYFHYLFGVNEGEPGFYGAIGG
jgi:Xaa-Pro dipeptidase